MSLLHPHPPLLPPRSLLLRWAVPIVLLLLAFAAREAHGCMGPGTVAGSTAAYTITAPSAYEVGCFGPCDCAVHEAPMTGTFTLRYLGSDPLYSHYAIEAFAASIAASATTSGGAVTGSGTYDLGGEVAVMQRLVLDLKFADGTVRRFDSGTVQGGGGFPGIDASAALHGFACVDTVVRLVAKPSTAGVPGPLPPGGTVAALPNPFRSSTRVALTLAAPATLDVVVRDAQGRSIAVLARGLVAGAGTTWLAWDGATRGGTRARPGTYVLEARRADGHVLTARLVRLE
jgi:hypothetical protein